MILAGDIGGTKTNIALIEAGGEGAPVALVSERTYHSAKYDSLEAILKEFIVEQRRPSITHACFGIAGPVIDGQVQTPNLAWDVSARALVEVLGIERVGLINDLEATAHGIEALKPEQLYRLNRGKQRSGGNRALIAAGTGLGMAGIIQQEGHHHPSPSEGGHIDFAPRGVMEVDLLNYLAEKYGGHVSYERVISGPGLYDIYCFLRLHQYAPEPDWLAAEIEGGDDAAAVSKAALAGKSELAVKALDMFVSIYGAMAGNLALLMVATGGLYVGGGIAPKILEKIKDGTFMRAFTDKGRFSSFNAEIPVHVILDDKAALYGAARCALLAHHA
ncbi:MAG TPA: glucokinase [Pyrinomonadaceae bacterium]|jgi:glucokinase